MRQKQVLASVVFVLSLEATAFSPRLNVTAIGARDGSSTFECWQLDQPFEIDKILGTASIVLDNVTSLIYHACPSNLDPILHNAPNIQWAPLVQNG